MFYITSVGILIVNQKFLYGFIIYNLVIPEFGWFGNKDPIALNR